MKNLKILGFSFSVQYIRGSKQGKKFLTGHKFTILEIRFAQGKTSRNVLLLPLPPPLFQERRENFNEIFTPHSVSTTCKLFPLPSSGSFQSSLNWEVC